MSSNSTLTVNCPACNDKVEWTETNAFRPFCSESCKNKDFIGWANEEKRLTNAHSYDDIFSEQSTSPDE